MQNADLIKETFPSFNEVNFRMYLERVRNFSYLPHYQAKRRSNCCQMRSQNCKRCQIVKTLKTFEFWNGFKSSLCTLNDLHDLKFQTVLSGRKLYSKDALLRLCFRLGNELWIQFLFRRQPKFQRSFLPEILHQDWISRTKRKVSALFRY